MPAHKITLEFEATVGVAATSGSKSGWTETWYDPANSTDATAQARALGYASWRDDILTPGWTITAIRGSQLDANNNLTRKGFFTFIAPQDGVGKYPGAAQDEQPYDALECRVVTATGRHRSFGMRGIPQEVINAGGRYVAPANFVPRFGDWVVHGLLATGDFGSSPYALRIRNPGGRAAVVNVVINPNTVPNASPMRPVVILDGNVNFAAGQTVNLSGILGMTRINGSWIIDTLIPPGGANTPGLILRPKRRIQVGGTFQPGGTAVSWAYTLDSVVNATAGYGTSRRTGRPPILVRGRRSNRSS